MDFFLLKMHIQINKPLHFQLPLSFSNSLPATAERGEKGPVRAPTGEVAAPLRLRWPLGPRRCGGSVDLRPAG
jgi:hypothetical protein